CGRHYEIIEYDAANPVPEMRRFLALEISAAGVKWIAVDFPVRGYMLLPASYVPGYRGIDRNPFYPTFLESEMEMECDEGVPPLEHIWQFYPLGWRRDAYKLYEESLADNRESDEGILLSTGEVAREIRRIIERHVGPHEILDCDRWRISDEPRRVAFPGA